LFDEFIFGSRHFQGFPYARKMMGR
jgi:hypothetical protein